MGFVKRVSIEQAEKNVRDALFSISNDDERASMTIALMQYQDALNAESEPEEELYTVGKKVHGEIVKSDVVSRSELQSFLRSQYNVNVRGEAVVHHIRNHDAYVVPCIDKGEQFDLIVEPHLGE